MDRIVLPDRTGRSSDAGSVKTTAVKDGDFYVINGTKRFITNAPEASIFIAYARTNQAIKGAAGVSAIIVDAKMPGMVIGKRGKSDGLRKKEPKK